MRKNRAGQVSIFVIVAIVIVVGILVFALVRGSFTASSVPEEFREIYDFYEGCIVQETEAAVQLAGAQGGRIDSGEYVPGSDYAPFSSHLNFLGFPVPYWFYVSGNGVVKENVPTEGEIEEDIAEFVASGISNCYLDEFYAQGFYIEIGEPEVSVDLRDEKVIVSVSADLASSRGENSARKTKHGAEVNTKLGKFYKISKSVYENQKDNAFLEEYGVDVLRLYAPVDGVEISCSPTIWRTQEVADEIKSGLSSNIGSLKLDGNYYRLSGKEREYYIVDEKVDEAVNFIYSASWPTKVEITGGDEILVAEPIGNEQGLGAMGFCYQPYHFVYDVSFPVMIQIYSGNELFQFPVVAIIDNNVPREAIFSEISEEEFSRLCEFATEDIEVNIFDAEFNRIDGDVYYNCFNQQCRIGSSENGKATGKVPACVNGFVEVRSEGYSEGRVQFSSNEERIADVILDREFEVEVQVLVDEKVSSGNALVNFVEVDGARSASAAVPGASKIRLSEGLYELRVYVYENSDIVIPKSTKVQCFDVPKSGILGFFGAEEEKCQEIVLPETKIDYALSGGGSSEVYVFADDLARGKMIIKVDGLPKPTSLERLQLNYQIFEEEGVQLEFE